MKINESKVIEERYPMKDKIMKLIEARISGAEDNACRARMQFGRMTPRQLDSEYGESGQKCRDLLDEAETALKEAVAMKTWFTANVADTPFNQSGEQHESCSHQH